MAQSLVLITVDCLRADHVGFLGYSRKTTPFLDELAGSSTVFMNAIVAGAPTYYSFPAIMASRYPLALGRDVVGVAPGEPTIASVLKQSGYATAAFLAGNPYLSPKFGYDTGFDTFKDFLAENSVEGDAPKVQGTLLRSRFNESLGRACHFMGPIGLIYDELYFQYCQAAANRSGSSLDSLRRFPSADVIVNEAAAWLENVGTDPFFLWLHFMDPHSPYYPKEGALIEMTDNSTAAQALRANSFWNRGDVGPRRLLRRRDQVVTLYDAGIRWVDLQINRLVDKLRTRNLWDNCVFAVTADHGEEFLEHGGRYHSPSRLTEELIHAPLLVHVVQAAKPQIHHQPFSLVDLAPTLLDVLDIPEPATFRGTSFWARSTEEPGYRAAIVESVATCKNPFDPQRRGGPRMLAIRESQYKLVFDFTSSQDNLFDLKSDAGELRPLPDNILKPVRRRLLERARKHIAQSIDSRDANQRLDGQLRDLRLECGDSIGNAVA